MSIPRHEGFICWFAAALVLLSCSGGSLAGGGSTGKSDKKPQKSTKDSEEEDKAGSPASVSGAFLTACGPADYPSDNVPSDHEAIGCGVYSIKSREKLGKSVALGPIKFTDKSGRIETVNKSGFVTAPPMSKYHSYANLPRGMPADLKTVTGSISVDNKTHESAMIPQKFAGDWSVVDLIFEELGIQWLPGIEISETKLQAALSQFLIVFDDGIVSEANTVRPDVNQSQNGEQDPDTFQEETDYETHSTVTHIETDVNITTDANIGKDPNGGVNESEEVAPSERNPQQN